MKLLQFGGVQCCLLACYHPSQSNMTAGATEAAYRTANILVCCQSTKCKSNKPYKWLICTLGHTNIRILPFGNTSMANQC